MFFVDEVVAGGYNLIGKNSNFYIRKLIPMEIQTQRIMVSGLVQGIGFRPFIAELAEALELTGQVKNLGGVVEIIIQGNKQAVDTFIHRLSCVSETGELPGCRIDSLEVEDIAGEVLSDERYKEIERNYARFEIVDSSNTRELRRFLPVDMPTCDRCIGEMHDPKNRRYRYPFISCTACGPRFSIQKAVPYDRDTITMDAFPMCDACYEEYTQKGNIRRHAQTIACEECGPELKFVGDDTEITDQQQAIALAVEALKAGKIGAIKDIGGFHFAFSPMNADAAMRLREFKNRDKKPFAVMFLNVDLIKEYCEVSPEEERLLMSSARPIVLLKKKKDFVPEICGESDRIGALLPCNPIQILLLEETGPLVMTSGNRGGEPIIISDKEMMQHLDKGIDFILTHNREILTPLDDSIYQVVEPELPSDGSSEVPGLADERYKNSYVQLIRRARGLVPEPIAMNRMLRQDTFAAGGDLKAAFAYGRDELVYMSQYFGDLDDVRCFESRQRGRDRMEQLLDIHPEYSLCDMHPGYVSVQEELSAKMHRLSHVQHHHAHIASVIAEHGLEGKIIGVACDGTGYGTDGTIWGSEFLLCEDAEMVRVGYFSPVKLLGGDASAKQADMTLLCYMLEAKEKGFAVQKFFEEPDAAKQPTYVLQEAAWRQNINVAYSSSMGRLFDAAAALLDICHCNSYEGECAIKLEQAAHQGALEFAHIAHNLVDKPENILHVECVKMGDVWQAQVIKLLVDMYQLKGSYSREVMAYAFHQALAEAMVELVEKICEEQKTPDEHMNQIALSGGCFLNRILTSCVIKRLQEKGKDVYINEKVPCGDGGIALGQMYLATFIEE